MTTKPNSPAAETGQTIPTIPEKERYLPPRIEIIEIEVEQGFAQSSTPGQWEPGGDW